MLFYTVKGQLEDERERITRGDSRLHHILEENIYPAA